MPLNAYHWRGGLHFELTENRCIHIFRMDGDDKATIALIPRDEWSSILGHLARTANAPPASTLRVR